MQFSERNKLNIKQIIKEFDEIDFSLILKNSFHVTLQNNKVLLKKRNFQHLFGKSRQDSAPAESEMMKLQQPEIDKSAEDLSLIAGKIVTNALHIPRSLFCPFCADEYMFEFTLKDHLKRRHTKELMKRQENDLPECEQSDENHLCPYCKAVFYLIGLIPKHVANYHGRNWLQHWQQTYAERNGIENRSPVNGKDNTEPSIIYAKCSPGLSDIFEKLITKDSNALMTTTTTDSPLLKSILKKTPKHSSNRIITSPSGVSIRRNKSEIVKRSVSVRRELRFDLPPLQKSPTSGKQTSPTVVRKHRKLLDLWRLFRFRRYKTTSHTMNNSNDFTQKCSKLNLTPPSRNIVTSTPINFLDDNDISGDYKRWNSRKLFPKKFSMKRNLLKNRPLLFTSERYQCACCNERYQSNPDLLMHLKEKHQSAKYMLMPHYKCGQCGVKFFRNSYLVRHCHFQHTPQKNQKRNE